MATTMTLDQLYEVRAALSSHHSKCFNDHAEMVQSLEIGSQDLINELDRWNTLNDNIKAAEAAINEQIDELLAVSCPKPIRRRYQREA